MSRALAARRTDATTHGGTIVDGAGRVRIGGEPAARLGDPHTCPLTTEAGTPHVGGVITEGSRTVRIGRKAAARMGDSCDCNTVGIAGRDTPRDVVSDEIDRDLDGDLDGREDRDAVWQRSRTSEGRVLGLPVFFTGTAEVGHSESERHAHGDLSGLPGSSVAHGGEAAAALGTGTLGVGPANQPYFALSGEGRAGRVQERVGHQWGDSGRETGSGSELRLGGDLVNIQGGVLIDLRAARLDASIDGGAGLGIEHENRVFYDHQEGAFHLRAGRGVSLGALSIPGFNFELTIPNPWRDAGSGANAGIPNTIAEGCPTVRIG